MGRRFELLGPVVRELRKEQGWSQAELAQRLGCSAATVAALEMARYQPSLSLLEQVLEVFDLDLAGLQGLLDQHRRVAEIVSRRQSRPGPEPRQGQEQAGD